MTRSCRERCTHGIRCGAWLGWIALTVGCQPDPNAPPRSAAPPPPPHVAPPAAQVEVKEPAADAPLTVSKPVVKSYFADDELGTEIVAPEVVMSDEHRATCRVQLGETFPDLDLQTLDGQPTTLAQHLGPRLTVVVFWNREQPMSVDQIRRLLYEFEPRYGEAGVTVVTVNVGDPVSEFQEILPPESASVVHLSDPQATAFAQVATGILPRTYLVQPDFKLVWFDLEYTRSARRELKNAIRFVLKQLEQQANSRANPLM